MKIVFAIAVLILTSSLASAALLTVNCSVVSSPTELNANIVCPQFSGGGLTSVQISVSGGITGSITLTNNASTSQTVTGTTSSAFSIGALAGFTIVNPIFSASYTTGPQSLTAGQSKTFAGLSGTGSDNLGTDTTVLAPYTGAGTFNIAVSTLTALAVSGGGGQVASAQSTSANGTATVTYNSAMTGVPEPGTLAMIGLGILGLAFVSRRLTA